MFGMVYLIVLVKKTISDDDDVRNCDDVGKFSNETDRDSGSMFDRYLVPVMIKATA